ncbi:MAG TPA: hypothetical protein VMV04_15195 [Thermodesulfobacteriota bacterium]|nr:hypothetical protein [Thermodesulfobacteriota bacterium]
MSLKNGILNLIAFGVVLLLVFENYETWTQPIELFSDTQKRENRPVAKQREVFPTTLPAEDTFSIQSVNSISKKNIFNPDRKDFPILEEKSKPMVRPQVVLYGVTIAGDYQAASIANPGRPLHKGERETFSVKLGEKVGEYQVAKISSDRITLEAEKDSFEVLLYDFGMSKQRAVIKTDVSPATITTASAPPAPPAQTSGAPIPSTPSTPSVSVQPSEPSNSAVFAQAPNRRQRPLPPSP